jgi:hypothetical protein
MSRRKKVVVRMLEQAVQVVYGPASADLSGIEPDRSELDARRLLKRLHWLTNKDPGNEFGTCFVRLQLKLLKRLRKFKQ